MTKPNGLRALLIANGSIVPNDGPLLSRYSNWYSEPVLKHGELTVAQLCHPHVQNWVDYIMSQKTNDIKRLGVCLN